MEPQTPPYREAGASLLLVSLRAHGDSEGRLNDFGWSARHDVVAAVEFLRSKGHERIFVDGVSLGAAAAVFAGAELAERVDGYILECPYQDLHRAVDTRTHMFLPPGVATVATRTLEWVSPLCIEDYRQISLPSHIGKIPSTTPVLILGGEDDVYAPRAQLDAVAKAASQAELVVFADTGHNELRRKNPARYDSLVAKFLSDESKFEQK